MRVVDLGRTKVYVHDFEEQQHPRAKSGSHGGEFVKKGSGGGSTTKPKTEGRAALAEAPNREKWPAHIVSLKLPPAWTDVRINNDPNGSLLAVGKDAKGRDQYVYSAKFAESQAAKKFQRVKQLSEKLPQIQAKNDKFLASKDDKVKEHAECTALIMGMGIRPGSERETGAEKTAYGATTLKGSHVVADGNDTYLRFTGKKGVDLNLKVDDKGLAQSLRLRAKKAGPEGQLFPSISERTLRSYTSQITNGAVKPKDFRTLLGTKTAYDEVRKMQKPTSASAYKKQVMSVAKVVSEKLGNTAAIALKAYISPFVFSEWKL